MNIEQKSSTRLSLVAIIFLILLAIILFIFLITFFFYGGQGKIFFSSEQARDAQKQSYYVGGDLRTNLGEIKNRKVYLFFWDTTQNDLLSEEREIVGQMDQISEIRETLLEYFLGSKSNLRSPIPEKTRLREVYLDMYQTVYVDVTHEFIDNHPGGVYEEIYTLLGLIRTIRENFPLVARVQILVEGQEIDTLAGHIITNKPLTGDEFRLE
jgi:spore germination protein GerM